MSPRSLTRRFGALAVTVILSSFAVAGPASGPLLLDEQFDLPPGFHIYRAAGPELAGGSYDIALDGQGRLLAGDGNAVRRLRDTDEDGVYDQFEVIAQGLGGRGPQGLLVWGDRLYAVGGDGLQLFDGYDSGQLVRRGRLGEKFSTGGDHDLHTVFRGPDGWLYLMAGNGAGIEGRRHITETNSPMRQEREASVFRLDPDGRRWECLAAGGRNPPGLGMNYLGELFSFDSDMEWHVGLPFYKPVRLVHWAIGTDQGWQEVGAYPDYFIDCAPSVMSAGRGSPNWGTFYEHEQFPARYRHAFLNCDYRWKRESNDQYVTSGRLVAFFLRRDGAGWKADMETLVRAKPNARDAQGRPISFALVDVEVAPDGSLLVSDHNQGLWRVFYAAHSSQSVPTIVPAATPLPATQPALLKELLRLPQPSAEWSRLRAEAIRTAYGSAPALTADLKRISLDRTVAEDERLRAIHCLAPDFTHLDEAWLRQLGSDPSPEIRGQSAWLLGLRDDDVSETQLLRLFDDSDPMVRRRAAEGLTRSLSPRVVPALVAHLNDESRLTRLIAMNALARHPMEEWATPALARRDPQTQLRALVAVSAGGQSLPPDLLGRVLRQLLEQITSASSTENQLDLLRVLALFAEPVKADADLRGAVTRHLLTGFPASDRLVCWEQARLIGRLAVEEGFGPLLSRLRAEADEVTQFHLAESLARLPAGWTPAEEDQAVAWFVGIQQGWFNDAANKGVQFPEFWATAVSEFASHHRDAVVRQANHIDVTSALGAALIDLIVAQDHSGQKLIELYRRQDDARSRSRIGRAFQRMSRPETAAFLRDELGRTRDVAVRSALTHSLAAQPVDEANVAFLVDGLRSTEIEVVRACANALLKHQPALTPTLAEACLDCLAAGSRAFQLCEKLLIAGSGRQRSDTRANTDSNRRPQAPEIAAAVAFWKAWYTEKFGRPAGATAALSPERADEEIHRFILSDASRGGQPVRGALVYERLQCHTCHGGGAALGREGRIFGPDLAGVTRRLSRAELADSMTDPSKVVADRFKAFELEKADGSVLTGFVTDQTGDSVTFADAQQVHRIPRVEIARLAPQTKSLMPERLLNALTDDEARDLLAYLDNLGAAKN